MIKGKLVGLVAIEKKDLKQLLDWRNNPAFRQYFREHKELSMAQQILWYEKKVMRDSSTLMFSIKRLKDRRLIGCCGLVYISWAYKHADLSLYIGWKDLYIDTKGYAEEAARLLLEYGFDELGLNKIWTEIYVFDKKKKKLYENMGFKIDGTLRENYFYKGKFWDSYIMSILASDWTKRRKKG